MNYMKGQYRIVLEVMLFAIGVAITSFVLVSFQDMQQNVSDVSITDQLNSVLNNVINGIVKASLNKNSIVRIDIPVTISKKIYRIRFDENSKKLIAQLLQRPDINVTKEIFNIEEGKIIEGDVVSSAGIVEISYNGTDITIRRG